MRTNQSGTVVLLGISQPMNRESTSGGDVAAPARHLQQSVTRIEMRTGFDDPDVVDLALSTDNDRMLAMIGRSLKSSDRRYAIGLNELEQIVAIHSGRGRPDWVASGDEAFARVIAAHFGCPVGEPTGLLTNGGRDALHSQHMGTAAQPAAFNYMAVTASTTTPAATDTTLTGEITTASGGLLRAQATFAHTAGTNTSTLTKTFTVNGSDVLPVTLAQIGIFNASSSGTLGYHTALNSTATLAVSGDSTTITETLTAG